MSSVDDALDSVISTGCLTSDEQQEIQHPTLTQRQQIRTLLQYLQCKGQRGFKGLVAGLENSRKEEKRKKGNKFVAQRLKEEKRKIEDEGLSSISNRRG